MARVPSEGWVCVVLIAAGDFWNATRRFFEVGCDGTHPSRWRVGVRVC
jgi:hypothetical protein